VRIQNRCTSCASLAAELNRLQAENSRLREKVAQYKRLMCAIYQFSAEHRQFFEELRPAASDRMAAGNMPRAAWSWLRSTVNVAGRAVQVLREIEGLSEKS